MPSDHAGNNTRLHLWWSEVGDFEADQDGIDFVLDMADLDTQPATLAGVGRYLGKLQDDELADVLEHVRGDDLILAIRELQDRGSLGKVPEEVWL